MPFRVYTNSPQQVDRGTGLSLVGGARIVGIAWQGHPGLEAVRGDSGNTIRGRSTTLDAGLEGAEMEVGQGRGLRTIHAID